MYKFSPVHGVGAWLCISLYDAGKWGRGCVQSGSVSDARSMEA